MTCYGADQQELISRFFFLFFHSVVPLTSALGRIHLPGALSIKAFVEIEREHEYPQLICCLRCSNPLRGKAVRWERRDTLASKAMTDVSHTWPGICLHRTLNSPPRQGCAYSVSTKGSLSRHLVPFHPSAVDGHSRIAVAERMYVPQAWMWVRLQQLCYQGHKYPFLTNESARVIILSGCDGMLCCNLAKECLKVPRRAGATRPREYYTLSGWTRSTRRIPNRWPGGYQSSSLGRRLPPIYGRSTISRNG